MQEQVTTAAQLSHESDRAKIQAQLTHDDEAKGAQRQALLSYLEELRQREDEAGQAIRDSAFSDEVEACLPPADWSISAREIARRLDLRDAAGVDIFSIDPPGCVDWRVQTTPAIHSTSFAWRLQYEQRKASPL